MIIVPGPWPQAVFPGIVFSGRVFPKVKRYDELGDSVKEFERDYIAMAFEREDISATFDHDSVQVDFTRKDPGVVFEEVVPATNFDALEHKTDFDEIII